MSGSWGNSNLLGMHPTTNLCCLTDIPELSLQMFWDLESVGILPDSDSSLGSRDNVVLENFNKSIRYCHSEQRYEVSLPWKDDPGPSELLNNATIARSRLKSLGKHLDKNPELKLTYNAVFTDMENTGIITEVATSTYSSDSSPVFYLPHRPIVKEASLTTKVRPVFDASCKSYNGLSLNDCLETGPSLIPNIVEILLRFR